MSANDDLDRNEPLIKSETEVEPVLIIESNNNKEDLIDQIKKDKEKKKVQQIVKDYSTQRDGYLHANCFSKLFFYWAFRIIKLANFTTLKNEHLGKCEGPHETKSLLSNLDTIWYKKKYKDSKCCPLMCTIMRSNMWSIIGLIVTSFIIFAFQFGSVYTIKLIINYFNGEKFYDLPLLYLGIGFMVFKLLAILITRQNQMTLNVVAIKSVIELNCFILDKIFKASPSSMKRRATEGEIVNFLQVDSHKLGNAIHICPDFFISPIQIVVYLIWLFSFFGFTFAFGLGTLLFFMLINFIVQKNLRGYFMKILSAKDERMKITTETFNCIKVLKLYAWEGEFLDRVIESRRKEMNQISSMLKLMNWNIFFMYLAPISTSIVSIGCYQYFVETLEISNILIALTIFSLIQEPIRNIPYSVNAILETVISMNRIQAYLYQDEIDENVIQTDDTLTNTAIKLENCNFSWGIDHNNKEEEAKNEAEKKEKEAKEKESEKKKDNKEEGLIDENKDPLITNPDASMISNKENGINNSNTFISTTEKSQDIEQTTSTNVVEESKESDKKSEEKKDEFKINLKNINLKISKGEMVGLIGEVGSGKSTLLSAILNNLILTDAKENNSRIVINGEVCYASQIPWIQNETLKENILFFKEFNKEKYDQVIELCQLKQDLEILQGGDMTEIGEKGINLSGGQKARVALARSLYADKDIYLLDDPISALDAHVGSKIMTECILKHMKNKTRVLVTNAVHFLKHMDKIVYMKDGEIAFIGTYKEIVETDFYKHLTENIEEKLHRKKSDLEEIEEEAEKEIFEEKIKDEKKDKAENKIISEEEKETGFVKFSVYLDYFKYSGGLLFFIFVLISSIMFHGSKITSDIWLAQWTRIQEADKNLLYFGIYSGIALFGTIFTYVRTRFVVTGAVKLGRKLHDEMVTSLVNAPINLFHDKTPKGRIYNRLSSDIDEVQDSMYYYGFCFTSLFNFIGALIICSIVQIWCVIIMPVMLLIGSFIVRYYISASRDLTRMESIAKSPILNSVTEAIPGTMIIRAYKNVSPFVDRYTSRLDELNKIQIYVEGTLQWFGISMDFIAYFFMTFLITFAIIFEERYDPQSIDLLLTYALNLQYSLFYFLKMCGFFSNFMINMERCLSFTKIDSEKPLVLEEDKNLGDWPSIGKIEFLDYSVKYRPDTPLVLKNISFNIEGKEKIRIVGRTGSGKSTMCLSLFRLLEPTSGAILIDGVDITKVGLRTLRSKLTIIPQDPSLIKGTLHYNIDPIKQCTDEEIKEVMTNIGFWYIAEKNENGLNMIISENGDNVSVREKQLICITRAILRKSKIVVMDEATANIDIKTKEKIQNAINILFKHSTIVTIAHRIKTIINYDKILVLQDGNKMEFDSPQALIKNKESIFYDLYSKSTL